MIYMNKICADAGTVNCPCPLAETGDCLICSRLAGKGACDCSWAGLCIYNEYIQNDSVIRNRRENEQAQILKKIWYDSDLLVLVLKVSKGFALNGAKPGSFVFLNGMGKDGFANVPVSIMRVDAKKGHLYLALKVISAKTKTIAAAEGQVCLRGVYRNGLLGGGLKGLEADKKWLIFTKGVGFAPAVNLLRWADGKVETDLIIDTEKINEEIVNDQLRDCGGSAEGKVTLRFDSLNNVRKLAAEGYDKVMIMASDYYIKTIAESLDVPAHKLVFSNNFHMCCGEGICGACGHVDSHGALSKMCKCRRVDVKELL